MKKYLIKVSSFIGIAALLVWFSLFLAQKIDLTTADLGRHIKNGEVIVQGSPQDFWNVIHTNFYSYTNPGFPFVNHHWGSGIVFYFIHQYFNFWGLSIFYILLGAATFWLFFDVARRASNVLIALAIAVILIPLMASRAEVRPEMFTYFFSGVYFWILWNWETSELRIKDKGLWILPLLMLVWVNLHVGFFFGICLIGAFGTAEIINDLRFKFTDKRHKFPGEPLRHLIFVGLFSLAATLINPSLFKGALYPLNIFKNYGYLIVENQSVKFLENINHTAGMHFTLFKVMAALLAISFLAAAIFNRKKFNFAFFFIAAAVTAMAYFGIRNFPFFGFFALPILAFNIKNTLPEKQTPFFKACVACASGLVILYSGYSAYLEMQQRGQTFGLGLMPFVNDSANFFNENKIQGPVFNNYDIGGYLIYNLYPKQKVFTDNRPEAYPTSFFQNVYIPAQADETKWKELDNEYNFNAIFFGYHDYTPWAQTFLIRKIQDPAWAPVFADSYNIIFVKRNAENQDLIKKYEIPQERFGVVKN